MNHEEDGLLGMAKAGCTGGGRRVFGIGNVCVWVSVASGWLELVVARRGGHKGREREGQDGQAGEALDGLAASRLPWRASFVIGCAHVEVVACRVQLRLTVRALPEAQSAAAIAVRGKRRWFGLYEPVVLDGQDGETDRNDMAA